MSDADGASRRPGGGDPPLWPFALAPTGLLGESRAVEPLPTFADRADAGRRLAGSLEHLRGQDVVVLGLPRGGVPVASEVARALTAPLDVIMVRKLGVPFQPELAMGAIGEGGVRVVNPDIVRLSGVSTQVLADVEARERIELERRARRYRGSRPPISVRGRTAVVVDNGIATGSTARAACQVARARGAARVVLAVPVAPLHWAARIGSDADECVSVATPATFFAIGEFYADFAQTTDDEVAACLAQARHEDRATAEQSDPPAPRAFDGEVEVSGGGLLLPGHLTVPEDAYGLVVFAHGSGSSRHSPRNRYVARALNLAHLGTLLFDLLTAEEELSRANVFDVGLLAGRLVAATAWLRGRPATSAFRVGYFGASTGAAAALWAAAEPGADIAAVVSRGGRPDLAGHRLAHVTAATLLVVGGRDEEVLELNRTAQDELRCESRLSVVPGATHLFEEPGALETVADLARDWFVRHLGDVARGGQGPSGSQRW